MRWGWSGVALSALVLGAGAAVAVAQERAAQPAPSDRQVRQITMEQQRRGQPATADQAPVEREGIPSQRYVPVSEGALPDESADLLPGERATAGQPMTVGPAIVEPAPIRGPLPGRRPAEVEATPAEELRPSERTIRPDGTTERDVVPEGITRQATVTTDDPERYIAAERDALRAEAIENIDREPEDDPYAPLGLRLGTVTFLPSIEQGLRATSNAYSSPNARSSIISETNLRLGARSDWARHAAELNAYGSFRRSVSGAPVSEQEAGIDGNLRIDLADGLRGIVEGSYVLRPESANSPSLVGDIANRAQTQDLSGTVGLEKDLGNLRFAIRGSLERTTYGDADLVGGGSLSQEDRNSTLALASLRAGYAISPALVPFVEVELGRRYYDLETDSLGYRRAADRYGAKLGAEIDLGDKLTGEIAAGFLTEELDDARLGSISGALLDASLAWSPVRETTVTLAANTTVEGATSAGDAGSLLHTGSLSVERRLRANLTGNVSIGGSLRDYAGSTATDLSFNAEAGLTWWLNRYTGLSGSLRHETFKAADSARDYSTNSVFLGLTVRR